MRGQSSGQINGSNISNIPQKQREVTNVLLDSYEGQRVSVIPQFPPIWEDVENWRRMRRLRRAPRR